MFANVVTTFRAGIFLGPGEVKNELEKVFKKSKGLPSEMIRNEPADKVTERQVSAKVRGFFSSTV